MQSFNKVELVWPEAINPAEAEIVPIDYIVEGYAARGLVTVIGGAGGSGKSMLNQYLFQKRDNELLNTNKKGFALYLTGADTSDSELNRRAHSIEINIGLIGQDLPEYGIPFICDHKFYKSLVDLVDRLKVDTIIFDTLADFHHGNPIEVQYANETMQAFRSLASQANVAIILITHTRKGSKVKTRYDIEDISDSRIFTTKADFVFGLKSEYKNDSHNLIELQCLKNRCSKPIKDLRMKIFEDPIDERIYICKTADLFEHEEAYKAQVQEKNLEAENILHLRKQNKSYREIEEMTGVSKSKVGIILKKYTT